MPREPLAQSSSLHGADRLTEIMDQVAEPKLATGPECSEASAHRRAGYLGEFRLYWRSLAAAGLGQAAGFSLVNYIGNIFTPHLIDEFSWSRSQIALVSTIHFLNILSLPIAGRLTDVFGVRRIASVGVVSAPLAFIGLSFMTGDLWMFFLLSLLQLIIVGGATNGGVYGRLIVQTFDRSRGGALAIAACLGPIAGAVMVPFLSGLIDLHGWRAGYVAVAVCVGVAGLAVLVLIPPASTPQRRSVAAAREPSMMYGTIVRSRAFQLIFAGVVLCNLSFTMQTAHLKVIFLDRGIDSATGSFLVSLFAISVIIGRLLAGLALDRFPTYAVMAITMGLPCLGLGILASGSATIVVVGAAVLLIGFSIGAEGDIFAYAVGKYFKLHIFNTVLGLVFAGIALSIASGSLLLSLTLKLTGGYTLFMSIGSAAAFMGGVMFMLLKRVSAVR